ncbi:hypothetical protein D7X33_03010 [Butyricicoccus sp. 1XD8-22]|nr:hypothetical protein D7X33_03010 [Butyricicoccus sp. 1XD8-22]
MGAGLTVILIIALIWYVFQVIAYWKIFEKFGEAGWKSIIPFYNTYIQFKATWNVKMFAVLVALLVLVNLSSVGEGTAIGLIFAIVSLIAAIAILVILVMSDYKLSKAFGHGAGFTVGLVLLDPIFKLILGFGGSQYIGNTSQNRAPR